MTSRALVTMSNNQINEDDMFFNLEPASAFEVKKVELAAQLNALMVYCGKNRSDMAESLGCKKSHVTRLLSGKSNFTIKTIWDFASHLDFDFDVVFRTHSDRRPTQPWQAQRVRQNLPDVSLQTLKVPLQLQSAQEVAVDFLMGRNKAYYVSFNTCLFDSSQQALPATIQTNPMPAIPIPPATRNLRR